MSDLFTKNTTNFKFFLNPEKKGLTSPEGVLKELEDINDAILSGKFEVIENLDSDVERVHFNSEFDK